MHYRSLASYSLFDRLSRGYLSQGKMQQLQCATQLKLYSAVSESYVSERASSRDLSTCN